MESHGDKKLSSERVQASLLAAAEKRLLVWLAKRMPLWVTPDLLTFIGLLAMALVGGAYLLVSRHWVFLLAASAGLVLNWFGDSLDGTLARVRGKQRPKYGYYLDHLVDAFGVSLVLFGLAFSGLANTALCFVVLAFYLIMSINVYLATQTVGEFRISFSGLSPTEGRLLLIALNVVLLFAREVHLLGRTVRILDAVGVVGAAVLLVLIIVSAARNLLALDRSERALWQSEETPANAGNPRNEPPVRR